MYVKILGRRLNLVPIISEEILDEECCPVTIA